MLPLLVGSVVLSDEIVLLVDRKSEPEPKPLELRVVLAVLNNSLVLDDKEFEIPVPKPAAVGKGGILPVP